MQEPYSVPLSAGQFAIAIIGAPGAGNNWTYTLPDNFYYRPKAIIYTLTTDVTVGNRLHVVRFTYGVNPFAELRTYSGTSASVTCRCTFAGAGISGGAAADPVQFGPMPPDFYLRAGTVISSLINNLQAGDTLTAIALTFDRWVSQTA